MSKLAPGLALAAIVPGVCSANCDVLVHDGGWSADGPAGIVALVFKERGDFSYELIDGDTVSISSGSWRCSDSTVEVNIGNEKATALLLSEEKAWVLRFQETGIPGLSERALGPFGF
jgi:hypothetical protein